MKNTRIVTLSRKLIFLLWNNILLHVYKKTCKFLKLSLNSPRGYLGNQRTKKQTILTQHMVVLGPFTPDRWRIQTRVWSGPFCRLVLYEICTCCENFIVQITALASLSLFIGRTVTILPGKTLKISHKSWLLWVVFNLHQHSWVLNFT